MIRTIDKWIKKAGFTQEYQPFFSMFQKNNSARLSEAIFRLSCLSLVVSRILAQNKLEGEQAWEENNNVNRTQRTEHTGRASKMVYMKWAKQWKVREGRQNLGRKKGSTRGGGPAEQQQEPQTHYSNLQHWVRRGMGMNLQHTSTQVSFLQMHFFIIKLVAWQYTHLQKYELLFT